MNTLSTSLSDIHHEFDYFFWFGDLNYRIEWTRDAIISNSDAGIFDEMLSKDQLFQEMGVCCLWI